MPPAAVTATAPGKVILVGEHAVVYGRPAIAAPVWEVVAQATVRPGPAGQGCRLVAHDLGQVIHLDRAGDDEALAVVARAALARLGLAPDPDWQIDLTSAIPIASGMGSGAALSAALVRALYAQAGAEAGPATVSELVYAGELIYHGTPSGVDNTVVAYGKPVWFVRGEAPQVFVPQRPFMLAIADSGAPGLTKQTVAGVRERRAKAPAQYDAWFDEIADLVHAARAAIEDGAPDRLGPIFDRNHALLCRIGVSTPTLDRLVAAARAAGAAGAKLSGGGGGGNLIALVDARTADEVATALTRAGAARVIVTTVAAQPAGVAQIDDLPANHRGDNL
jgi:mevalonate kinase